MRLAATSASMSRSEVGDATSKPEEVAATVAAAAEAGAVAAAAAGCVRGGGNCE